LAKAEVTVDILSTSPSDGVIGDGETAKIYWRIESDCSLDYVVEVGGDGTVDSGEQVSASDGSGSFSGTKSSSTTIDPEDDFDGEDGDYTIYVIATCSNGDTDYASTMITLDTPPDQVTGLSVGRGDGKLFLSWEPVDTEDIDYYLVYYGTSPGSTDGTAYDGVDADDGLVPSMWAMSTTTNCRPVQQYTRITSASRRSTTAAARVPFPMKAAAPRLTPSVIPNCPTMRAASASSPQPPGAITITRWSGACAVSAMECWRIPPAAAPW
jgi:hypothetical protein